MKTYRLIAFRLWLTVISLASVTAYSQSPTFIKIQEALRAGNEQILRSIIAQDPSAVHLRDDQGDTPLILASYLGTVDSVKLLLNAGAEPNATNSVGATPLIRAATDPDKVTLLLKNGARIDARTELGNTPLLLAARRFGSAKTIRALLRQGADPNARNRYGCTPLMAACAASDLEAVTVLVEGGADVNAAPDMGFSGDPIWNGMRTPLGWAALRGNTAMANYLLNQGADVNAASGFGTVLSQAVWGESSAMVRLLLERGAEVDQTIPQNEFTALHWAASLDRSATDVVQTLLHHGANPNAAGGQAVDAFMGVVQTPLLLAEHRGRTPVVEALLRAGAGPRNEDSPSSPVRDLGVEDPTPSVAAAFAKAIPPLQRTAAFSREAFLRHGSHQNCLSCHQQYLPMAAVGVARQRHLPIDLEAAAAQIELGHVFHGDRDLNHEVLFHPEPAIGHGYALLGLHAENQPSSALTDIMVHHLAVIQTEEGSWPLNIIRPPIQSSKVTATALAIFALSHYGWPARAREFERAEQRARQWLRHSDPSFHEERVFQILGLVWAGDSPKRLRKWTDALMDEQRDDGGWAQLPGLSSDAYATGQAIFALHEAGLTATENEAIQRGRDYLLRTQLSDGTWHVRRRAFPFQPTMNSGFPHGRDSWISAMATSWALLALAPSADSSEVVSTEPVGEHESDHLKSTTAENAAGKVAVVETPASIDFARDIRPVLERSCVACHRGEKAKSKYRLETREGLLAAANQGVPSVLPGQGGASPLVHFISDIVPDMEMPPLGKRDKFPRLTETEVALIRQWIQDGAIWPADVQLNASTH